MRVCVQHNAGTQQHREYIHQGFFRRDTNFIYLSDHRHEKTEEQLQAERSWVRFPMASLEFFTDIILMAALRT